MVYALTSLRTSTIEPNTPLAQLAQLACITNQDINRDSNPVREALVDYCVRTSRQRGLSGWDRVLMVMYGLLLDSRPPRGLQVDTRFLEHMQRELDFHLNGTDVGKFKGTDRWRCARGFWLDADQVPQSPAKLSDMVDAMLGSSVRANGICTYTKYSKLPTVLLVGIERSLGSNKLVILRPTLKAGKLISQHVDENGISDMCDEQDVHKFNLVSWMEISSRGQYRVCFACSVKKWRQLHVERKSGEWRAMLLCYQREDWWKHPSLYIHSSSVL